MNTYVTLADMALLLGLVFFCIACTYLIFFLRNLNGSAKVLRNILQDNRVNISKTLDKLPILSENMVEISNTAKNEITKVESILGSVGEVVEMTTVAAQSIRKDLIGKVKTLMEFIELIKWLFFDNNKTNSENENEKKKSA